MLSPICKTQLDKTLRAKLIIYWSKGFNTVRIEGKKTMQGSSSQNVAGKGCPCFSHCSLASSNADADKSK